VNSTATVMSSAQYKCLAWLAANGGRGAVNQYGRVFAGKAPYHCWTVLIWMKLVAAGFVAGADGHLHITDAGRAELPAHIAGIQARP